MGRTRRLRRRTGIAVGVLALAVFSIVRIATPASAAGSGPAIHFVVDVSGSMAGDKLSSAVSAIKQTAAAIPDSTALGLRSYAGQCDQSSVPALVPLGTGNDQQIDAAADSLVAGGGTPTTAALGRGLDDLAGYGTTGSKRLVLLTDGDTQCGISICDYVKQNLPSSVAITLYAVGLQVSDAATADLTCAAEYTGGAYIPATSPEELADALREATGTAPRSYVALGDSFSSGEGVPAFEPATNKLGNMCHRSFLSYPYLLAADRALRISTFTDRACSGATSEMLTFGNSGNHEPSQLDHLTAATTTVTLSIGGNDVAFSDVLKLCITGANVGASSNCATKSVPGFHGVSGPSLDAAENQLIARLGDDVFCYSPTGFRVCHLSLHELYAEIARRSAPGVTIKVLLYPHLFTTSPAADGCTLAALNAARISRKNIEWINRGVDKLDAKIISEVARARAYGVAITTIDPRPAFDDTAGGSSPGGHGACTAKPWLNGLILNRLTPSPFSFHPNRTGQSAFYTAMRAALGVH